MDLEQSLEVVPDIEASPVSDGKVPLGICKQMVMKLDSLMSDAADVIEDPDITEEQRQIFRMIMDQVGQMGAAVLNIIKDEIDEDDFMAEQITMDEIMGYPGEEENEPADLLNAIL